MNPILLLILLSFVMGTVQPFTVRFCDPHKFGQALYIDILTQAIGVSTSGKSYQQEIVLQPNQTANIDSNIGTVMPYIVTFTDQMAQYGSLTFPQGAGKLGGTSMSADVPGSLYIWFEKNAAGWWVLKRTYIADYNTGSNDCNSSTFAGVLAQAAANNTQVIAPFNQSAPPSTQPVTYPKEPPSAGGLGP